MTGVFKSLSNKVDCIVCDTQIFFLIQYYVHTCHEHNSYRNIIYMNIKYMCLLIQIKHYNLVKSEDTIDQWDILDHEHLTGPLHASPVSCVLWQLQLWRRSTLLLWIS